MPPPRRYRPNTEETDQDQPESRSSDQPSPPPRRHLPDEGRTEGSDDQYERQRPRQASSDFEAEEMKKLVEANLRDIDDAMYYLGRLRDETSRMKQRLEKLLWRKPHPLPPRRRDDRYNE